MLQYTYREQRESVNIMLHAVISEVLNEVLGEDIGNEVDCNFSDNCRLDLMIDKIPYEDFVQKTKHFISESDIVSHRESKFVLVVTMNLTDEFIHKIMSYVNPMVISEFEEMKKSR